MSITQKTAPFFLRRPVFYKDGDRILQNVDQEAQRIENDVHKGARQIENETTR